MSEQKVTKSGVLPGPVLAKLRELAARKDAVERETNSFLSGAVTALGLVGNVHVDLATGKYEVGVVDGTASPGN